ncbi:uncharacterized protein [Clytia hemisphaerica]|uniref:uncharacterized protein n=1 Tax=Clytia hemisphaerica TaxID=252671 RepID=UPI0034D5F5CB
MTYDGCHIATSMIGQKYCCPRGKFGDKCQYIATCANKYHGICHNSDGNVQTSGKQFLGNFKSAYKCFQQCKKLVIKDALKWTACESYENLNGHQCNILSSDVMLGKPTSLYRAFYSTCWTFKQQCSDPINQTFSCHFIDRKAHNPQPVSTFTKDSREECAEECYKQKQTFNKTINAIQYGTVTRYCQCLVGVDGIETSPSTYPTPENHETCIINQESWLKERTTNLTELSVLSIDHLSGSTGVYFNFMSSDLAPGFFEAGQNNKEAVMYNLRTSVAGIVRIWSHVTGGSVGDHHGRFDTAPLLLKENQWQVGDKAVLVDSSMPSIEGASASDAGISCRRLKERHPHYRSGHYWVKYALSEGVARQWCDMDDGKGWMVIGHVKLDPNVVTSVGSAIEQHPNLITGDILTTNVLFSVFGLTNTQAFNEVTEVRIRCFKQWHGRTLDVVVKEESFARRVFTKDNSQSRPGFYCSRNPGTPNIMQFLSMDNSLLKDVPCTDVLGNSFIWGYVLYRASTQYIFPYSTECDDRNRLDFNPSFTVEGEWWFYAG